MQTEADPIAGASSSSPAWRQSQSGRRFLQRAFVLPPYEHTANWNSRTWKPIIGYTLYGRIVWLLILLTALLSTLLLGHEMIDGLLHRDRRVAMKPAIPHSKALSKSHLAYHACLSSFDTRRHGIDARCARRRPGRFGLCGAVVRPSWPVLVVDRIRDRPRSRALDTSESQYHKWAIALLWNV